MDATKHTRMEGVAMLGRAWLGIVGPMKRDVRHMFGQSGALFGFMLGHLLLVN